MSQREEWPYLRLSSAVRLDIVSRFERFGSIVPGAFSSSTLRCNYLFLVSCSSPSSGEQDGSSHYFIRPCCQRIRKSFFVAVRDEFVPAPDSMPWDS